MNLKAVLLLDKRDNLSSNLKILGKSFIELQLDSLISIGIQEIHILAGKEYFFEKDCAKYYFHKYNDQEGLLRTLYRLTLDSDILLLNAHSLFASDDLIGFINDFNSRRLLLSAIVSDKDVDAYYYPQIENGIIKKIISNKKEKTFAGAFLIAQDIINKTYQEKIEFFYEELFNWLLKKNKIINTYLPQKHFLQIDSLLAWKNENFQMLQVPIFEIDTPKIKNNFIDKNAEIDFTSFLEGSCYIGSNVSIGKNSLIKDSIIQANTVIADNCKIINSIIGEKAVIADKTMLTNCIIANGCNLLGNIRLEDFKLSANSIINSYSEVGL